MLERGRDREHRHHVDRDRSIDSPQPRQIEAAALVGVPPGQQKVRDSATLAGIALSDADQAIERGLGGPERASVTILFLRFGGYPLSGSLPLVM
jgi:hypothetical protein